MSNNIPMNGDPVEYNSQGEEMPRFMPRAQSPARGGILGPIPRQFGSPASPIAGAAAAAGGAGVPAAMPAAAGAGAPAFGYLTPPPRVRRQVFEYGNRGNMSGNHTPNQPIRPNARLELAPMRVPRGAAHNRGGFGFNIPSQNSLGRRSPQFGMPAPAAAAAGAAAPAPAGIVSELMNYRSNSPNLRNNAMPLENSGSSLKKRKSRKGNLRSRRNYSRRRR